MIYIYYNASLSYSMHHLCFNDFIIWSCRTTYHFAPTTSLGKQVAFSKQQISCSHQARGDSSIPGHLPPPFSSLTTLAYKGLSDRSVEVFDNLRQALRVYLRRWGFWASNMQSGQVCLVTFFSFWCLSYYVLGNLVPVKYIFISKFAIKEHTLCSWLILKYKLISAYFFSNWFYYVLWGQL